MSKLERLYMKDEIAWAEKNAELLEKGELSSIDALNLSVYLIENAQSARNAAESHMKQLMLHLLKWQFQPEKRSTSWRVSIRNQRQNVDQWLEPGSKKGSIRMHLKDGFLRNYTKARRLAAEETSLPLKFFPIEPPFTFDEAIDEDWMPS